MAAILFTGFPAAFAYHRQGRLDWRLALVAETTTMPGSFLGAVLTGLIAPDPLKIPILHLPYRPSTLDDPKEELAI